MRNSYSPDNCKVMIGGLEITSYSEVNTLPSIYIDGDVVRAYTKDGMLVTFKVKDVSKIPDKGYVTISYDGMMITSLNIEEYSSLTKLEELQ